MLFSVPSIVETKCHGLKNASITISYDAYESHVRDKNGTVSHMIIRDLVIPTGPETRKLAVIVSTMGVYSHPRVATSRELTPD